MPLEELDAFSDDFVGADLLTDTHMRVCQSLASLQFKKKVQSTLDML